MPAETSDPTPTPSASDHHRSSSSPAAGSAASTGSAGSTASSGAVTPGTGVVEEPRNAPVREDQGQADQAQENQPQDNAAALAGLDALQARGGQSRTAAEIFRTRVAPPVVALVAALMVWQLAVAIIDPRPDIMPGPLEVGRQIWASIIDGTLPGALGTSLWRGVSGFLIAVLVATPLALLIAQWAGLRSAVGPLITGLQVLPSVAWVPAAIVWFGLSDATVYFVVLMGAIPSIVNGMLSGIDQIPPQLLKAGRVLGADGWKLATKVVLPAAMPGYLAGLKQGWAFSWRSLMGAELIAIGGSIGFGLGSLLAQGRTVSDMAIVLTAVLSILLVGIVIELLFFNPLEKRLLRGRGLLVR